MKTIWHDIQLSELLSERTETPKREAVESGSQRIISKIRFSDGGIEYRNQPDTLTKLIAIQPGDLVLSGINATKGAIALYDGPIHAAATIHYSNYFINTDKVIPRFLWFYLRSDKFKELLARQVPKGIKTELKADRLLPVIAPFPDRSEQKRILNLINLTTAKIEQARDLYASLKKSRHLLWESILTDSFHCLNCDGRLSDVLLGKPRNGWSAKCDNVSSGIPVLSLSAVTGFKYNETAFKLTSLPTNENAHYWLKKGDFLITRSNTPALVGHVAIYNGNPSPCIYPDLTMRLPLDITQVDPIFLLYWMQTKLVRAYIKDKAKGTSPTMKKINQKTVMEVPYPRGISRTQQEAIVRAIQTKLTVLDQYDRTIENCEIELSAFLPALMNKVFSGEL